VMIDSTIVRAHACAAGYEKDGNSAQALGKSKGGFTTKIHTLVDALGLPIKFILTPGQVHDSTQSKALLSDVRDANVLGDKAYDSKDLYAFLLERGCNIVIPPRSNAKEPHEYDKEIYKERHLIECFFSKLKHFRRVFSRFDKTIISFSGFLNFSGSLIWMR
ncbi:IS5 family transposase, partial [Facilibium subflavum]|uniref:IS5 family transposase n=1 Tax=Facilibium subflavum TaxID=2219058 RepID=UPI000E652696